MQRTQLDLFSGIGGFALACRWLGIETIGFCEIEPYAQRVLRKNFPGIRIFEDVRKLQTDELPRPWIITGGYPCQPFSQAGKRRGEEDDRHLWPPMFEIIRSCRPDWVLAENVAGHVSMGLDEVLSDLESEDYTCQPIIIPACAVDAPHRRDRVWIVAHSNRGDSRLQPGALDEKAGTFPARKKQFQPGIKVKDSSKDVAHTESLGHRGRSGQERGDGERIVQQEEQGRDTMGREAQGCGESCGKDVANSNSSDDSKQERCRIEGAKGSESGRANGRSGVKWLPEPDVGRVAHGIPSRVDRLRGLGNAIVPQVAFEIINAMIQADEKTNESIL